MDARTSRCGWTIPSDPNSTAQEYWHTSNITGSPTVPPRPSNVIRHVGRLPPVAQRANQGRRRADPDLPGFTPPT
jgi:hypothetical protein